MKDQPTLEEVNNELKAIRAQHAQLKRQVIDLGARTAKVSKALVALARKRQG